jgi:hypothetical protein
MARDPTKEGLSPGRRWLLRAMQLLNFGRIERLRVRGGEPVNDPPPRLVRAVKLAGPESGPRPERGRRDFALRREVHELFVEFDRIGNGTVARLEVKHGVPFMVEIEEVARV